MFLSGYLAMAQHLLLLHPPCTTLCPFWNTQGFCWLLDVENIYYWSETSFLWWVGLVNQSIAGQLSIYQRAFIIVCASFYLFCQLNFYLASFKQYQDGTASTRSLWRSRRNKNRRRRSNPRWPKVFRERATKIVQKRPEPYEATSWIC